MKPNRNPYWLRSRPSRVDLQGPGHGLSRLVLHGGKEAIQRKEIGILDRLELDVEEVFLILRECRDGDGSWPFPRIFAKGRSDREAAAAERLAGRVDATPLEPRAVGSGR